LIARYRCAIASRPALALIQVGRRAVFADIACSAFRARTLTLASVTPRLASLLAYFLRRIGLCRKLGIVAGWTGSAFGVLVAAATATFAVRTIRAIRRRTFRTL